MSAQIAPKYFFLQSLKGVCFTVYFNCEKVGYPLTATNYEGQSPFIPIIYFLDSAAKNVDAFSCFKQFIFPRLQRKESSLKKFKTKLKSRSLCVLN